MQARYSGTCQYCPNPIVPGDEITRGNGERRHAIYAHVACKPAAGVVSRASWVVEILEGDKDGFLPKGHKRQFVHKNYAESIAARLRELGAKQVEVRPC